MKVVFKKNNKFVDYKIDDIEGYKFKPRKKINNLIIINREMINMILLKYHYYHKVAKNRISFLLFEVLLP